VTRLRAVAALAARDAPLAVVLCQHALTLRIAAAATAAAAAAAAAAATSAQKSRPNGHTNPAEGDSPTASDAPEDEETVQCLLLLATLLQQRAAAAALVPEAHSSSTSSSSCSKKKAAGVAVTAANSNSGVQDMAAAVAALRRAVGIATSIARVCGYTVNSSTNASSSRSSSSSVHTPVLRLLAQAQLALLKLLTSLELTRRAAVEALLQAPSSSDATNSGNTNSTKGLPSRGAPQWGLRSSAKQLDTTTAMTTAASYANNSEKPQWHTDNCVLADSLLQLRGYGHVITDVSTDVRKHTTNDSGMLVIMLVPLALLYAGKAYAQRALLQDSVAVAAVQKLLVAAVEAAASASVSSQDYSTVREACMAIVGLLVSTAAPR
jgi:hypothetical protein